jgi:putative aminopeptidase FrvX
VFVLSCGTARAQNAPVPGTLVEDLPDLVETPAVPGYEQELAAKIAGKLKAFSPQVDAQGNLTVTIGKSSPHRLIVTTIDEPGFVVSGVTSGA